MKNLISRKFVYAITFLVMGFVLVLLDKVTSEVFFQFGLGIGATYIVGNVVQKKIEKGS